MSPRRNRRRQGQDAPGTRRASDEWTPTGKRSRARRRNRDRDGRLDPRYRTSGTHRGTDRLREAVGRPAGRRQNERQRRMVGQARPWWAPMAWMWDKRPKPRTWRRSTILGAAGWLFVIAGIASFLALKGTTSVLTVGVCAVGFGVSTYLDHRERSGVYGRRSDTVRPMGRTEAKEYVQATREGGGAPPRVDPDPSSSRVWVGAHDRRGTDGVTGHYRDLDGDRVREREREQARERDADQRKRQRRRDLMPDIDGEWWEE